MASDTLTMPARRRLRCPKCHQILDIKPLEFTFGDHDVQLFLVYCPGRDYRAVASEARFNQAIATSILKYLNRSAH